MAKTVRGWLPGLLDQYQPRQLTGPPPQRSTGQAADCREGRAAGQSAKAQPAGPAGGAHRAHCCLPVAVRPGHYGRLGLVVGRERIQLLAMAREDMHGSAKVTAWRTTLRTRASSIQGTVHVLNV